MKKTFRRDYIYIYADKKTSHSKTSKDAVSAVKKSCYIFLYVLGMRLFLFMVRFSYVFRSNYIYVYAVKSYF